MNIDSYINAVLQSLKLSATPNRVNLLRAWARQENTLAKNNPFATTWDLEPYRSDKYIGGYYFNSNGGYPVKNYSTPELGVMAFVKTITAPGYYPGILSGLISGLPFDQWNNTIVKNEFSKYGGPGYGLAVATLWNETKGLPVSSGGLLAGFPVPLLLLLIGSIINHFSKQSK